MRKGVGADKRMPAEKLFFEGNFDTPFTGKGAEEYAGLLEMVRWAPSAVNKQPWRIVMTNDASTLPDTAKVFTDKDAERTLIRENVGDLKAMLHALYEQQGVVNLMLECGGNLLRKFLEAGLINEWAQIITPRLTGGPDLVIPGYFMPDERKFEQEELIPSGKDIILRGLIH